jgi:MoaA/NifB/PqqE/SkfB family radical SAM enzyme
LSELGWKYLTREDKAAILKGVEDGVAYGGPYHVEFHPADRCNIDCFFCSTAALRGTDEIPMPRFEEMLGELKEAGTRAIRLSGGGEPFFHRSIKPFLQAIAGSGIPIENVTTNAVLLRPEIVELILPVCDQITVSLNTGDEASYASMMKTNPKNFQRVVDNVKHLVAERRKRGLKRPLVNLQFLVWKENYRTIPGMYRLAREMGVDTILFNGLAYLTPEQHMSEAETEEMMGLYEQVVREDEFRKVACINSFEQDLTEQVNQMKRRIGGDRSSSPVRRAARFLMRDDFTLGEKVDHFARKARERRALKHNQGLEDYCIIGWHSMLVRTTGVVAPCCILQGKELGNVYQQSIRDVWHGEGYRQFRRELSRILKERSHWQYDEGTDKTVDAMCGQKNGCPIASFYYWPDLRFMRSFNESVKRLEGSA